MSVVEEILSFCDKHNERLREFDELNRKNQHTPIYWGVPLWLLFLGVFGGFIANFYLVEDRSSQLLNAGIIIGSAVLIFALISWLTRPARVRLQRMMNETVLLLFNEISSLSIRSTNTPHKRSGRFFDSFDPNSMRGLMNREPMITYQGENLKVDLAPFFWKKSNDKETLKFTGWVIRTDLDRKTEQQILVHYHGSGRKLPTGLPHRQRSVELVDPDFQRDFKVLSDDQADARVQVDPLEIEELKRLVEQTNEDFKYLLTMGDLWVVKATKKDFFDAGSVDGNLGDHLRQIGAEIMRIERMCKVFQYRQFLLT